ncbi:MAG TPA: hypothetical protein VM600_08245 [Actinomycetota bacterium]|nr:hypothetical protein [Actinomycetota bacterium]
MARVGDLEVEQDLDFQHRMWAAQRVGWAVIGLIFVAALLGLTGDGVLARATARTPDGAMELVYERIDRHRSPSGFEVRVDPTAGSDGRVEIWFEGSWIGEMQTESIYPEPDSVKVEGERVTYTFNVSGRERVTIAFDLTPEGIGIRRGAAGLSGGSALSITQVLLP